MQVGKFLENIEHADQNKILQVLHAIEEKSEPYVMSGETMKWVAFNAKVQIARLVILVALLILCKNSEVKTKMSELDKAWVVELLQLLIAFFVFINVVFIAPILTDAPIIVFVVVRAFAGTLLALYYHIVKGLTLYDELTKKELAEPRNWDGSLLHDFRVFSLWALIAFAIYLTVSLVCLVALGGLDGR